MKALSPGKSVRVFTRSSFANELSFLLGSPIPLFWFQYRPDRSIYTSSKFHPTSVSRSSSSTRFEHEDGADIDLTTWGAVPPKISIHGSGVVYGVDRYEPERQGKIEGLGFSLHSITSLTPVCYHRISTLAPYFELMPKDGMRETDIFVPGLFSTPEVPEFSISVAPYEDGMAPGQWNYLTKPFEDGVQWIIAVSLALIPQMPRPSGHGISVPTGKLLT